MSGTTPLRPTASRKQLLLMESELNRVQLLNELHGLRQDLEHFKQQWQMLRSLADAAAKLVGTFSAIGSAFTHREGNSESQDSWLSTLFKGVKTGAEWWGKLRSRSK